MTEIKVLQRLFRENNITADTTYRAFLMEWTQINAWRAAADENSNGIYGPVIYGLYEYYVRLLSMRTVELRNALWNRLFRVGDDEILAQDTARIWPDVAQAENIDDVHYLRAYVCNEKFKVYVNKDARKADVVIDKKVYDGINLE